MVKILDTFIAQAEAHIASLLSYIAEEKADLPDPTDLARAVAVVKAEAAKPRTGILHRLVAALRTRAAADEALDKAHDPEVHDNPVAQAEAISEAEKLVSNAECLAEEALTAAAFLGSESVLVIENIDLVLLEQQRRGLIRVVQFLHNGKLPAREDVEALEGIENMLNFWSDARQRS